MQTSRLNRRAALGVLATSASAAALSGAAPSVQAASAELSVPKPEIDGQLLINRDRATEVLTRFGLRGMIALNPINVTYVTNMTTIGMRFITEYPGFATYAADPQAPIYLVTGGTTAAWEMANGTRETAELMPYGFGGWNAADVNSDGLPVEPKEGGRTRRYHVRDDVELTEREKAWAAVQDKYADDLAAGAAWALARALKAQGVTAGKVAVDDMRIAEFLAQTDLRDSIECVPGYGIFQYIRMVKTPQELAYQRIGGRNNGDACLATVRQIEAGMTHDEVEHIFRLECAKRGNRMDNFIAGMPGGGFPDGVMVKGKPFLTDCVSSYKGYMGDTARTFIIGEPDAETKKRRAANQTAREAVFDAIKPGVKYSELRRIGFDTMVKHGMPEHAVFVTPHSVGLQHDDNPSRLPQFGIDSFDHVLEENMVLTVDLPYLEVGWGSGHNEDLFRVTKTGYEPLSTEEDPFIIL